MGLVNGRSPYPEAFSWAEEPIARGKNYLKRVQGFALSPTMVYTAGEGEQERLLWRIGTLIDGINADLQTHVELCDGCLPLEERREVEILAVPLAEQWGLDAFCNVWTTPVTILVDVGRVEQRDWLRLVVHEYAHAHVGKPGHHHRFANILAHLCLGLGLEAPPEEPDPLQQLRHWPPYRSRPNSLDFWLSSAH